MLVKKIYYERNRYSDIITYSKTRVKLVNGVDLNDKPEGDYINACFVNSPFSSSEKGDSKIIAS